jgi:tetratricopeptide (TPR) repeat protein
MASKIDTYNHAFSANLPTHDIPIFLRFLGEGRSILSNISILQADLYFHGGAGHFHEEHKDGLAIGERGEDHGEEEHEDEYEEAYPEVSKYNILFRIAEKTKVTEHKHLKGDQLKEIMPWLYYSTEIDPHNVLAYTLAGYYLAERFNKVDEAIKVLRRGLKNNPDSWQINAEIGRIYYQDLKEYDSALMYLLRAKKLIDKTPHDKFEERYVLSFLALTYKELGQKEEFNSLHKRINELFPKAYENLP